MILIRTAFALLAVTAFATIDVRSAAAETYRPWCVQYSGSNGDNGLTCAFTSFEQCMMTGGPGTGGSCVQNPWYFWYGEHGQGRGGDNRRHSQAALSGASKSPRPFTSCALTGRARRRRWIGNGRRARSAVRGVKNCLHPHGSG